MTHPSIAHAARTLGIHDSRLHTQLQGLEHDIGAPLYHRATATTPLRPTDRGTALIRALREFSLTRIAETTPGEHERQ